MARPETIMTPREIAGAWRAAVAGLLLWALPVAVIEARDRGAPDFAEVDLAMAALVADAGLTGASLVVVRDGATVFAADYGSYGPATRQPIASASKLVSAVVIARLVDRGVLSWDSRIGDLLPGAPVDKHPITLRQLFSHTSGLRAFDAGCLGSQDLTLADCSAQILALPLSRTPGSCFAYGGNSMHVAGHLAEVATGRSWDDLFIEEVAGPLGLSATDYAFNSTTPGYVRVPNPRIAGGARSTARDLGRVVSLLARRGVHEGTVLLSAATVDRLLDDQTFGAPYATSPDPASYGYGIGLWRNRLAATGAASMVASPGAFGTWPWVDTAAGIGGVFFTRNALGNVESGVRGITVATRIAVLDGEPIGEDGFEGAPMRAGCGVPR
jgi:CubicO group peptidase (beta-lactamase class C family)